MGKVMPSFFVFIYLAALLSPLYPVVDYALHKEYIAKVLCENKDKPAMHCNGKCHLMKQIKKASEAERGNPAQTIVLEQFLPHYAPFSKAFPKPELMLLCSINFNWQEPLTGNHSTSVFHPPSA
jgi:hypothetical protein